MTTPSDLIRALELAKAVKLALPIDDEMDDRISSLLASNQPIGYQKRKLTKRKP